METTPKKTKIGIVGYGYVGKALARFFNTHYEVIVYDPYVSVFSYENIRQGSKEEINQCELAIVCVPTQMKEDKTCDISIVEETIAWLEAPLILIKSTVVPGTTDMLNKKYEKDICFSPEYIGEGNYFVPFWKYPHPTDMQYHDFIIVGGLSDKADKIIDIFLKVLGPTCRVYKMTSKEAEIIKYMENSWIATKVTFMNEFYEMCKVFGADWHKVREGLLADNRIDRMFTMVLEEAQGFGGKCLPKDVNAIVKKAKEMGYDAKFLKEVLESNERFRKI